MVEMASRPAPAVRSLFLGPVAAVGAVLLLLVLAGAAVRNQTFAPAKKAPASPRQVTHLSGALKEPVATTPAGGQHYVAPGGRAAALGTYEDPWDLATALSHPASVKPGDTIWLRGGTYTGSFVSDLDGGAPCTSPIVVRSYPGEIARLDGAGIPPGDPPKSVLTIESRCGVYRDFEVTDSVNPNPDGGQGTRPQGLQVVGPDNKLVNLVIHDTGQGVGFWEGAPDSEITGCLIYYNGNSQLDHGIYTQNLTGTKTLRDNVVFGNYGFGIHAYTTNSHVNNFRIEGNVSFNNGKLNPANPYKSNFLLGSGKGAASSCTSSPQVAQNPTFVENSSYHPRGAGGREIDLGYSTGSCNPVAIGNYLVGDTTLTLGPAFGTVSIARNTFYGSVAGFNSSAYSDSDYLSKRPAGSVVFVRESPYEAGRAVIVVYNWDLADSVEVDLRLLLVPGKSYEIRDAQSFFGHPVASGIFDGGKVTLPLEGLVPSRPVGHGLPQPTGPEFNVFILVPGDFARAKPEPAKTPGARPREVPPRRSGSSPVSR
jgi:hypothetical protein